MNVTGRTSRVIAALVCAVAGFLVFQEGGNAARGYIDTRSLFYWWGSQWFDPASESQHGPLVVLIAVWLLIRNLRNRSANTTSSDFADVRAAGLLMGLALGFHVLAYAMEQTRLSIVALLVFTWGVLRLLGGKRWSDAAIFPLGFLLVAIPVGFLQPLGFYLRLAVSESAEVVLRVLQVSVVRNGTQLFAADGRFQYDVAAACSGVRSLAALVALSLVIGYVRLPRAWARVLLALTTLPFAFAGNFLRILAIVVAGQLVGQGGGERVHDASGFLAFIVVFALLLVTVGALAPRCPKAPPAQVTSATDHPASSEASARVFFQIPSSRLMWGCVAGVLATAVATRFMIEQLDARPPQVEAGVQLSPNGRDPVNLPEFIGTEWIGQRVEVTRAEREVLPPDTGYSRRNYVSVEDRSRQVFLSIVLSGRDRSSIHRPELCVIGQGWNIVDRTDSSLQVGPNLALPVTLLRVEREQTGRSGQRVKVSCWLAYWFVGRDTAVASHSEMIWRSSLDRLLHFRGDRWAYVVAQTPVSPDAEDGLRRMQEVVSAIWPQVKRVSD